MSIAISVIIPIHNCESELDRCLNSVLNQTFKMSFEVICILDSSNSLTYEIVSKYQKEFTRKIRVLESTLQDPGEVRNLGLDNANGDYIFFIDGDDFLEKDCLKTLYLKAIRTKTDIVIGNFYNYYPKSKRRKGSGFFKKLLKQRSYSAMEIANKVVKDFRIRGFVWNKLFKKEMLDKNKVRFIPTKFAIEDRPFLLQACLCSNKVFLCKIKTYNYVQHDQSFVKSTNKLSFIQKELNCDFALKTILLHYNSFDEELFKSLLSLHLKGIRVTANKILKGNDEKKTIKDQILKQQLVISGKDLYVYGAPWEETIQALNFKDLNYRKLPPSFQIEDLTKIL